MKEEAYRPMDIQELVSVFDISPDEYKVFKKTLKIMELEGSIVRTNKDKFAVPERLGLIKGRIQSHKKGFGFLIPEEDGERDVFIPSSFINGAMNNDRVIVQITRDDVNGKKREGEVIEILERANTKIIGVYEDSRNFGFVVPEDTRLNQDIFISKKDKNGANHGDIVIAEVTKWPDKRRSPEGVIKEVLGKKGEKGLDILTIIKKHGLPEEFPAKVLAYAEGIPEEIDEKEIKRRKDIRNIRMVTIDGEDAKDLDDAVSIEKLENGKYKLGVHIADVSHYVKEKNPLDKEVMSKVIAQTVDYFPADSYGFVFLSHSSSWVSASNNANSRSIGYYRKTQMNIPDFREALFSAFPKPLKFILFDSCNMQSVEVAYELRDCSEYFIGSPTEIPGPGAPYKAVVPEMFTETNLAMNIAEAYYGYYEKLYTGVSPISNENWTGGIATSVIKSDALDNLAAATKTIIPKYIQDKREVNRSGLLAYDFNDDANYDFDELIQYLTGGADNAEYQSWRIAFDNAVVYRKTTSKNYSGIIRRMFTMEGSEGLSTYIPNGESNSKMNTFYRTLSWYSAAGWNATGW